MSLFYLFILYNFITIISSSALEYPRNLRDLNYIEQTTTIDSTDLPDHEIAEQVFKKLRRELIKTQEQIENPTSELDKNQASRNLILLKQYSDIAIGFKSNCGSSTASDLLFLIDYHSKSEGSQSLLKYLRSFTVKLFERCKPILDGIFNRAIKTNLDEWTRANMGWLIDSMVNVKFGSNPKLIPKRPFSRHLLRQLVERPPRSAIVLYLARMGDIQVDDNMKNEDLTRDDFRMACDFSLIPFCRKVCKTLEGPTSFYSNLFAANLDHTKEAEVLFSKMDSHLIEWLAYKQICCKIVRPVDAKTWNGPNILDDTYKQLVSPSEAWEMADGASSLRATDFGYD